MDTVLDRVISPAEATEALGLRGIKISERTLRERARKIGAYRQIGGAMFFLPEDLERIMTPEPPCSNSKSDRRARIGSRGEPSTGNALNEAREKLARQRRESKSRGSSPKSSQSRKPDDGVHQLRRPIPGET